MIRRISVVAATGSVALLIAFAACGGRPAGPSPAASSQQMHSPASENRLAPRTDAPPERPASKPVAPASLTAQETVTTSLVSAQVPMGPVVVSDGNTVDGLIALIEEANVPAQEAGLLQEIKAREGDEVKKDDVLAKIDDKKTLMEIQQATAKWEAARAKAEEEAEKRGDEAINIQYARASLKVAKAEVEKAEEANRKVRGTVPDIEMKRLNLKVKESELGIEKAQLEHRVAKEEVKVEKANLDAAKENLNRRQILAPFHGVVVDRRRHEGEWVQPGDPVFHLIRMDKLWVEAYLPSNQFSPNQVAGTTVSVLIRRAGTKDGFFPPKEGKITFASPMILAGEKFLVRDEIGNFKDGDSWAILPGSTAKVTIQSR